MKRVQLSDGRIFQAEEILKMSVDDTEPVYKYELVIETQKIKSSKGHSWLIWDEHLKDIYMIKTSDIDIFKHKIITQQ